MTTPVSAHDGDALIALALRWLRDETTYAPPEQLRAAACAIERAIADRLAAANAPVEGDANFWWRCYETTAAKLEAAEAQLAAANAIQEPVAWQIKQHDGKWALDLAPSQRAAYDARTDGTIAAVRPLYASPPSAQVAPEVGEATHLRDWLRDGWTHCQHGTREWCEAYLKNAADVIASNAAALTSLSARLAEAERAEEEARQQIVDLQNQMFKERGLTRDDHARIATLETPLREIETRLLAARQTGDLNSTWRPVLEAVRAALHPDQKASDPITGGNADG